MKKLITARLQIKSDQIDAFIAAAQPLIAASRAEPGCISYTMYQEPTDRTSFLFFEEWKDQAAVDFHFATPHFTGLDAWLPGMLAGAPSIVIHDCVGQKNA